MLGTGGRFPEEVIDGLSEPDPGGVTTEMRLSGAQNPQTQGRQPMASSVMDHSVPTRTSKPMRPGPAHLRHESGRGSPSLMEFSEKTTDKEPGRIAARATRPQRESEQRPLSTMNPLPTGEQHRFRVKPSTERVAMDLPGVRGSAWPTEMGPTSQRSVPPSFRTTESMSTRTLPAPTIQVTIGRVEVRATAPPVSSQKQRPTPKRMSLDEYLGKRNETGR